MDREQMKLPPQPWEFRTKPAWQRLIIMVGGVVVNILLAISIYIIMLSVWGEQYLPNSSVKYGITVDSLAYEMGLRNGDRILTVDHKPVEDFAAIPKTIILEEAKTIQVMRDGEKMDVPIRPGFISKLIKHNSPEFISVRFPFEAAKFSKGSPAEAAGIKINDRIIGMNDSVMLYFDQFRANIQRFKNQTVQVMVLRGADTLKIPVAVPEAGLIGVYPKGITTYFEVREHRYNLLSAVPAGVVKTFNGAGNYIKSIKLLFSQDKAYESVGGFISIGNIFPSTWDWASFWSLTAFLSIMLAILNILPIPALDGGHVMFLLYEMVFRRKPSDKFMEYAQIVGMILLFGLLIFANGQDIMKLFR